MLRLTYDFTKINVSSQFIKIYIQADIFGTGFKSYCTIQTDYNNTGVFKDYIKEFEIGIGRNIINVNKLYVSNSKSANPSYTQKLRFIFYSKGTDMQATQFCVKCIRAYGYNLYNYDKIIQRTGVPYDIWDNQQCIFTNYIKAPHFEGDLQGTADNAKTVNSHTVEADVPSDAKFTDTTYDAVSTDDIQKWIDEEISIS